MNGTRTLYLHTFNGDVGVFCDYYHDAYIATGGIGHIDNAATSLRQLRREQRTCIRAARLFQDEDNANPVRYGYIRVKVPR